MFTLYLDVDETGTNKSNQENINDVSTQYQEGSG